MSEQCISGKRLLLLPGWALGPAPLTPLAQALRQRLPEFDIECIAYPELTSHRPESWVAALDRDLPENAWLAGWSLGGMLATALADWRGRRARGLITLAANASFVARSRWPQAMAAKTFAAFRDDFQRAPVRTLTRFAQLSAQGGRDCRRIRRELLAALEATPRDHALAGLSLLSRLDLRDTLGRLRIPQLHLFGDNDMLVPAMARETIAERLPDDAHTDVLTGTGHAFPLERTQETADRMAAFLRQSDRCGRISP